MSGRDVVKVHVVTEGLQFHVSSMIDTFMRDQAEEIKAAVQHQLSSVDLNEVIRHMVYVETRKAVDKLVKGAFEIDWDVQKDLKKAIAKMLVEKMKEEYE